VRRVSLQPEIKFRGAIASLSPSSGVTVLAFQPNTNVLFGVRQGVPLPLSADKLGHQTFHFDVEAMSVVRGYPSLLLLLAPLHRLLTANTAVVVLVVNRVQHQVPNHPYYDAVFDPSDTNRLMCVSPAAIVFSKLGARTVRSCASFRFISFLGMSLVGRSLFFLLLRSLVAAAVVGVLVVVVVERFQEHTTVKSFGWVLHANFAKDGESVYVVERPPKHIAPKLPAPITHKRNYGKG